MEATSSVLALVSVLMALPSPSLPVPSCLFWTHPSFDSLIPLLALLINPLKSTTWVAEVDHFKNLL